MIANIFEIKTSRIILICGICFFAICSFLENHDVARLSSLKGSKAQEQFDRENLYTVEKPDYPVYEVDYYRGPEAPAWNASDADKSKYENEKIAFDTRIKEAQKQYQQKIDEYNSNLKAYNIKLLETALNAKITESEFTKEMAAIDKKINQKEIDINKVWIVLILKLFSAFVMLMGALGILLNGDTYERAALLIMIGFAFKTIIGQ